MLHEQHRSHVRGHVPAYQSSWRLRGDDGEVVSANRVRMVQPADNSFCVAMDDYNQTANFQMSSVSNLNVAPMPKRTEANRDEPMFIPAMSVGATDDGDPGLVLRATHHATLRWQLGTQVPGSTLADHCVWQRRCPMNDSSRSVPDLVDRLRDHTHESDWSDFVQSLHALGMFEGMQRPAENMSFLDQIRGLIEQLDDNPQLGISLACMSIVSSLACASQTLAELNQSVGDMLTAMKRDLDKQSDEPMFPQDIKNFAEAIGNTIPHFRKASAHHQRDSDELAAASTSLAGGIKASTSTISKPFGSARTPPPCRTSSRSQTRQANRSIQPSCLPPSVATSTWKH